MRKIAMLFGIGMFGFVALHAGVVQARQTPDCGMIEPKVSFEPNGTVTYNGNFPEFSYYCMYGLYPRKAEYEQVDDTMKRMPLQFKYVTYMDWAIHFASQHQEGSDQQLNLKTVYTKIPEAFKLTGSQEWDAYRQMEEKFVIAFLAKRHNLSIDKYVSKCKRYGRWADQCQWEIRSVYETLENIKIETLY